MSRVYHCRREKFMQTTAISHTTVSGKQQLQQLTLVALVSSGWQRNAADPPDFTMNRENKRSYIQEEHSIHWLVSQAMQPPHVKHMRH